MFLLSLPISARFALQPAVSDLQAILRQVHRKIQNYLEYYEHYKVKGTHECVSNAPESQIAPICLTSNHL